jgi:hypothetical protein
MPYRVFISSTKKDLENQREYVIKQLRDAGLTVDPMENWPADVENPAILSAKRMAGCHFCVALVGFRRGVIAQKDVRKRSITQIDIDAAIASGLKPLVFILRDTSENRQAWPREFNELDDPRVVDWRNHLQSEMVCGYFDATAMPEVLPAVTRQIVNSEKSHRKRYVYFMTIAAISLLLTIGAFLNSEGFRDWSASRFLAFNDPVIFQHSQDGVYKIARLLNGRSDIQDNTKFREEILGSRTSFSLFANTFGSFRDYAKEFEALAKGGVRLRFIITDFSEENRANWESFNNATETLQSTRQETLFNARNIRDMILDLKERYPSLVDIRLNRKPLFYTLWLRDPESSTAIAHLGITYYGGKSGWPAFRMSNRTGPEQISSLKEQFEIIWRDAMPANR